jgi:hypothetical protein
LGEGVGKFAVVRVFHEWVSGARLAVRACQWSAHSVR